MDQGIRLLDPFLLASGEHKFIYIPGNILKKRNPANKPLTSVCTLVCLASVSKRYEDSRSRCFQLSESF